MGTSASERVELCPSSEKDEGFLKPTKPSMTGELLYHTRESLSNPRTNHLTLYEDRRDPRRSASADNDLKFVLYMYEVRRMRDIFGRISTIFEVVRHKR